MNPENNENRRKLRLKFIGLYILSLALLAIALSAFWGPLPAATIKGTKTPLTGSISQEHQLLVADELLHEQFDQLVLQDRRYSTLLKDSATGTGLKTIIQTISDAEISLGRTVDSIQEAGKNYSAYNARKFEKVAVSFRMLLENRAFASRGHIATVPVKKNADSGEAAELRKDLEVKQEEIATLKKELKDQKENGVSYSYPVSPTDKLRKENDMLKLALRSQVEQLNALKKKVAGQ